MHEHAAGSSIPLTAVVLGGALLVLLGAYLAAVVAGARRGRPWPLWRTGCAVAGVVCGLVAVGPLGSAAHHDFVAHMWGHLLLGMAGPLLLVLSAPVTVALRGLPVRAARSLSAVLASPYVRTIAHPVTAATLNVGGLWLLYTTSLHGWMHTSNVWHLVIHAHVLLAGWVFTAAILQVDPVAHPTSHRLRAGVLIGFLALHSILAKRIYAHPPAGVPTGEAQAGAQLMYYGGDYIDVVLIALLCLDWYRRTAVTNPVPPAAVSARS